MKKYFLFVLCLSLLVIYAGVSGADPKAIDTESSDGELESVLVNGAWMDMNFVAGSYSARYEFLPDHTYTWGGNLMDGGNRELYKKGFWKVEDGVLYLTQRMNYVAEGGSVENSPAGDTLLGADYVIRLETSPNPSEFYAVEIIGEDPEGSAREAISLDGQYWYNFPKIQDLLEDFRKLDSRIGWINLGDVKGPVKTEQDIHPDGETGFASGVLQKGAFFHDGRGEWMTYYYVEVGANQYKYLSGGSLPESKPYEVMVYSTGLNGESMKEYLGKYIYFKGEAIEAHTIYHRRDIVVDIYEIKDKL